MPIHPMKAALAKVVRDGRANREDATDTVENLLATLGHPTPDMLGSLALAWNHGINQLEKQQENGSPALRMWQSDSYRMTFAWRLGLRAALGQPWDPATDAGEAAPAISEALLAAPAPTDRARRRVDAILLDVRQVDPVAAVEPGDVLIQVPLGRLRGILETHVLAIGEPEEAAPAAPAAH